MFDTLKSLFHENNMSVWVVFIVCKWKGGHVYSLVNCVMILGGDLILYYSIVKTSDSHKMSLNTLTCSQLISLCKDRKLKGYSGKRKDELLEMLNGGSSSSSVAVSSSSTNLAVSSSSVDPVVDEPLECDENGIPLHIEAIPEKKLRVKNTYYMRADQVVWWNGKQIKCEHKLDRCRCKKCIQKHPELKGSNICQEPECTVWSIYGYVGGKATYCFTHKKKDMLDIVNARCLEASCSKRSVFGVDNGQPTHCATHRKDGMVDVISARCIEPSCNIRPSFNNEGGRSLYCNLHKKEGMINVVDRRCLYPGCKIISSFGEVGGLRTHCASHKTSEMVDLKHKHCLYEGCCITPSFGYAGKQPERCACHKLKGMLDVVNRKCISPDCGTCALFGVPGDHCTHCAIHRECGDISYPRSFCAFDDCDKPATYGLNYPRHCQAHKLHNDMDLVYRNCSNCTRPNILNSDGQCCYCDPNHLRPRFLARQRETKEAFDMAEIEYIYDRPIDSKFCPFRPDFLHSTSQGLITETDEHQHKRCFEPDEITRMLEITRFLGKPTLFIRFNPDRYKPLTDEPWTIKRRLDVLVQVVKHWHITPFPTGSQTFVIYMFYDREDYTKWYNPSPVD